MMMMMMMMMVMMMFKRGAHFISVGPTTDLHTTNNRNYYDPATTMHILKKLTFGYKFVALTFC